jgi:hypothetical protein
MWILPIEHTWDGVAVDDAAIAVLTAGTDAWTLTTVAPWARDPAPSFPPGPTPRLWEHEVVELFLAGPGRAYLEVEIGPFGHHLVLQLADVREPGAQGLALDLATHRSDGWWAAQARIPTAWLPQGCDRANAYRIHGPTNARRYLAHAPLPGPAPDFHQPSLFPRLARTDPHRGPVRPNAAVAASFRRSWDPSLDVDDLAAWTALAHRPILR